MAATRKRHGLQDADDCVLCSQEAESADQLTASCVFKREMWFRVPAPLGLAQMAPEPGTSIADWWLLSRARLGQRRKGFDTLVILGAYCLGKERNRRVFDGLSQSPSVVTSKILEEGDCWTHQAGYSHLPRCGRRRRPNDGQWFMLSQNH